MDRMWLCITLEYAVVKAVLAVATNMHCIIMYIQCLSGSVCCCVVHYQFFVVHCITYGFLLPCYLRASFAVVMSRLFIT